MEPGTAQQFSFIKRPTRYAGGRLCFGIPAEVSRFILSTQFYEVVVRPVGTLQVRRVP